ncbi:MAG: carbohydrate ABC transporter permease [Anaerolineaceae bacterium]|nr:carbohydrate ABC transporter permease [Anaerolineaceae bacterium]
MGKRAQTNLANLLTYIVLLAGAAVMVVPFLWMASTSFKLPADQFTRTLFPPTFTLDNYKDLMSKLPFAHELLNSLRIAFLSTLGQLLTCSMAAFAFAVVKFRFREPLFILLLITFIIPYQVTLVPNFIIFKWIGLSNTEIPLWLPSFLGGAFGTFLLRQYFLTIPRELAEAARVDGASLIQIFWKIYLPLARPALAALGVFTFMGSWNSLLQPLIYLPSDLQRTTITVGLSLFQSQYSGRWTIMMAGTVISVLPMIVIFFIAQKQFIEGIALTGVKR